MWYSTNIFMSSYPFHQLYLHPLAFQLIFLASMSIHQLLNKFDYHLNPACRISYPPLLHPRQLVNPLIHEFQDLLIPSIVRHHSGSFKSFAGQDMTTITLIPKDQEPSSKYLRQLVNRFDPLVMRYLMNKYKI